VNELASYPWARAVRLQPAEASFRRGVPGE
jgi:hypothetical protein